MTTSKKTNKQRTTRRGRRRVIADTLASSTAPIAQCAREFVEWLRIKQYAAATIKQRRFSLNYFLPWCLERGIYRIEELSQELLDRYQRYLQRAPDTHGQPMSAVVRTLHVVSIGKFCWWLVQQGLLADNPASKLVLPKLPQKLPGQILSHAAIEAIIAQPDLGTRLGIRDRAILEVFYSTGIRRAELMNLGVADVDLNNGLLYVRRAKGGKQRVVPLGERAGKWVNKYLLEVRGELTNNTHEPTLFVNARGYKLSSEGIGKLAKRYIRQAGYRGCCHAFRHAMATQMLDHGADLRHIQEMLGHERINTTQVYTHTSLHKLQEVYEQTYPGSSRLDTAIE